MGWPMSTDRLMKSRRAAAPGGPSAHAKALETLRRAHQLPEYGDTRARSTHGIPPDRRVACDRGARWRSANDNRRGRSAITGSHTLCLEKTR